MQGRCDGKEAKIGDELIEVKCDSKKWNINNMNASEWGINLHPVSLKKGSCNVLESWLVITLYWDKGQEDGCISIIHSW